MEHLTTRIWAAALWVLLLLVPAGAWALGLGNIDVSSTLNEPLQARIDLSALQSGDLDSMQVQLASAEQFRRAGIDRPFGLSKLQFTTVADGAESGHIAITTRDPVVEPFLNFLIEVTWPRGRIVREYTVLLDPPVYGAAISTKAKQELAEIQARALQQPPAAAPAPAPAPGPAAAQPTPRPAVPVQPSTSTASAPPSAPAPEPSMAAAPSAEPMPAPPPEPAAEPMREPAMAPAAPRMQAGARPDAHDVQWGDTLWSLARRYRPDESVSIQRMMLAMLSANPDAFNIPNINALRAGTVLHIPDVSQFGTTDRQVILAEVERQNGLWQEYRQGLAASASSAPEGAGVAAAEPTETPAAQASEASASSEPAASSQSGSTAEAPDAGSSAGSTQATSGSAEEGGRLALVSGGQGTEGVGSATTESGNQPVTAEQLAVAREEADAKTREAEELSSRVAELEGIVDRLERAIELRDDNIAQLQQTLRELEQEADQLRAAAEQARAEAAASGAVAEQAAGTQTEPMVETPPQPVAEAPSEPLVAVPSESQTTTPEPAEEPAAVTESETQPPVAETASEPATQTAAQTETAPAPESETVAAAGTQEQAAPAEKKPKKKKKKKKKVKAAPPPPQPSFLESILDSLPVDPVLLGAGVGGLLVVLGGAALWRRRRGSEDAEDMGELDLGDLDESDLLYDESGEPYLPDDVGEETAISELEGMDLSDEEAEPQVQAGAAEEDPLEATHVAPPGAAGMAESEDDPLTEVNVYLAYERYDQAEELVRSAIAQYPDRHEYKLRLLEVFYAAKDLGAFESSARELQEAVGDDSPLMGEARKMWQDMSPGRELFSEAESTVPEDQDVVFDVTGGDTETPATVPGSSLGGDDDSSSVDFDLGFDTEGTQTEAASGESSLDFDLGFDQSAAAEEARDESGLDLDLTSIGGAAADEGGGSGVDFDLGDEASSGAASGSGSMDFDLSGIDESMGGSQGPSTETPLPERASRDDDDLDFDLEGLGEGTLIDSQVPPEAPAGALMEEPSASAEGDDGALDFDLEGIGGESDDLGSGGLSGDAEFTALDLDLDAAEAGAGSRASGLDFDAGDDLTAVDDASSALGFDVGGDSVDAAAGAGLDDALDFGLDLDDDGGVDVAGGADVTDETVKLDLDASLPGEGDEDEHDTVKLSSPEFDAADSAISDLGMDLDLDMGDDDGGGASSTGVDTAFEGIFGDEDSPGEAAGEDDMALSLDGSDLIPPTPPPEPEAPAEEFPEIDLDFDSAKSQDAAASDEYESTQFMLRDMPASESDKSGASSEGHTLMLGGGLTGEVDEVQTKLDLAQAYIDMGDTDGAKGIIDEVLAEGNATQKNAAMGLLSKLASS